MPGGHEMFTPPAGRTISRIHTKTTPQDYISPAAQRHTPLTSVNTPSVGLTPGTTVLTPGTTLYDDEREKKERRRSKVIDLQRRHISSPATNHSDRRRSLPQNGLSNQQVADHYANCIKLSAENKINAKNAFGLHLIDYMSELLKKKELNNFQVASSTLDASAKIYAGRVDAIHTETYKVLSGLGRSDTGKGNEAGTSANDEDADAEVGEDGAPIEPEKKRKRAKKSNTVETNLKTLNVNKFDLEFEVDPLFHQTSAAFDEGGTGGLLMNHLHMLDDSSELVLDSNTIVGHVDSDLSASFTERRSAPVDLSDFRTKFSNLNIDSLQICPEFADFSFTDWSLQDEDPFSSMLSQPKPSEDAVSNQHAFDLDAEAEPVPGLGEGGEEFMDDFGGVGDDGEDDDVTSSDAMSDMMIGDGKEAQMVDQFIHGMKTGSIGTLMQILAAEPSDYSYFNSKLLRTWAGPAHWKAKKREFQFPGHLGGDKGKRKKKEAFVINYDENIDFDSYFKEKRAAITLTKATLDKYSKSKTTLPEDLHYDVDKLFRLFCKAKLMIKRQPGEDGASVADDAVENYDYDNAADRASFCPADHDDDSDNEPLDFDLTSGNNDPLSQDLALQGDFLNQTTLKDKLVSQPNKVAKIDIGYAKTAKKVDVKRLKSSIWNILLRPEKKDVNKENDTESEASPPPNTTIEEPHSFQKMVEVLPKKVSATMASNLSVPIAFVCLLHLANEKTLHITSDADMSDLQIAQG